MKPGSPQASKILVVTLSNLGDVVLTLPVFQSLLENHPGAAMDVIAGSAATAEIFSRDPRIRRVLLYEKNAPFSRKWEMLRRIRAERYDLLVDLRRSLFGLLGGAHRRNSYFSFLPPSRSHRVMRHLYALKGLVPIHHTRSFLWEYPSSLSAPAAVFLKRAEEGGRRVILAAPGSKSDLKKWPVPSYAALLEKLSRECNAAVALIGDKSDIADAEAVRAAMAVPAENFCGRTDFGELVGLVKKADLVVTNDSAPLHIADALRRPALAIFGPTDPRKYGPRYRYGVVARRRIFCAPCEKAQCRFGHECMKELGVEEVFRKASAILADEIERKNLNILVIRLDRIGDVTLSLPAVQALRDRFPNASISVMTRPVTAPLVEGHPAADEAIPYFYEKKGRHSGVLGNFRFIREIIRRRFDIVFILNPSLRSYLVPFCAGIPYRVGFRAPWPFLLTHSIADRRDQGAKHEAEYTLDVVRAFGVEAGRADSYEGMLRHCVQPHRTTSQGERLAVSETDVLTSPPGTSSGYARPRIVAMHPGASCPSKRWPVERFAGLGKKIRAAFPDVRLAIVGGKEEKALGEFLAREINGAEDYTDKLSLKELASFLAGCELLVSNDSGPVHIASAVGTRTLTIFGRSLPGLGPVRWRPLGSGHAVIQKDVGCALCLAHCCTIGFECLNALSVEEVWEKVSGLLSIARASEAPSR